MRSTSRESMKKHMISASKRQHKEWMYYLQILIEVRIPNQAVRNGEIKNMANLFKSVLIERTRSSTKKMKRNKISYLLKMAQYSPNMEEWANQNKDLCI